MCKNGVGPVLFVQLERHQHRSQKSMSVGYHLQLVAIDILGPLPQSEAGNIYVHTSRCGQFHQMDGGLPHLQPGGRNCFKETS